MHGSLAFLGIEKQFPQFNKQIQAEQVATDSGKIL
jgi:hypothetical protein